MKVNMEDDEEQQVKETIEMTLEQVNEFLNNKKAQLSVCFLCGTYWFLVKNKREKLGLKTCAQTTT